MKKEIHPQNYRDVAFKDGGSGAIYIIKSCAETKGEIEFEGQKYPLLSVEISSSTHPFYTGDNKTNISTGRVERFKRRLVKAKK